MQGTFERTVRCAAGCVATCVLSSVYRRSCGSSFTADERVASTGSSLRVMIFRTCATSVPAIKIEGNESDCCAWPCLGTQIGDAFHYLDSSASASRPRIVGCLQCSPSSPHLIYRPTSPGIVITHQQRASHPREHHVLQCCLEPLPTL
jgi:hypothetical protein